MGNLDQIPLCAERMLAAGYRDGWGVGRHIYGSNYFHYIRDPWMGLNELFWDIDFIPENAQWEVETAEAGPDSLYQWATVPPPKDFLHNTTRRPSRRVAGYSRTGVETQLFRFSRAPTREAEKMS